MKYWCFAMIVVALALLANGALAAKKRQATPKDDPWQVSYELALKQAKESNRPVLACFLGSDWCPYCIRLLKESIWTNEFKSWAADKAVVLIVDFPKNTPQLPALKAQNELLQQKYQVKGFPNVVLISADGEELGRLGGYSGKEPWERSIMDLVAKAKTDKPDAKDDKSDAKTGKAKTKTGKSKAKTGKTPRQKAPESDSSE
jgi:protein disulfide-isomerase